MEIRPEDVDVKANNGDWERTVPEKEKKEKTYRYIKWYMCIRNRQLRRTICMVVL